MAEPELWIKIKYTTAMIVAACFTTLVGLYICLYTVGRRHTVRWQLQMSQIVPTGKRAGHAKQALIDMHQRLLAEGLLASEAPPEPEEPPPKEVALTQGQEIISVMTESQIEHVREVFALFDRDGGGTISWKELRAAFKSMGQDYTKQQVKDLVREIDEDGNGEIDIDEFCVLMAPSLVALAEDEAATPGLTIEQQKQIQAAFEHYDTDGSGEVDERELCAAMKELGTNISADDCKAMILAVDEDGSGTIDINEFTVMMAPLILADEGSASSNGDPSGVDTVEADLEELGLTPRPPSSEPQVKTGRRARRQQAKEAALEELADRFEKARSRGILSEARQVEAESKLDFRMSEGEIAALEKVLEAEKKAEEAKQARADERQKGLQRGMGGSSRKMGRMGAPG